MHSMAKPSFFLLLLLLLLCHPSSSFSSGKLVGSMKGEGAAQTQTVELGNIINERKFLMEISLDYENGKANDDNDPIKKPGNGKKNP
ncbi:hypothetical protein DsansV1_C23g0178901 [Dioscorea sansibarensis]